MTIIDKAINAFRGICRANKELPIIMITASDKDGEIYPRIYYSNEFSVEEVQNMLLDTIVQLRARSDNANNN